MPEGIVSQVRFEAWLGQHYLSHETIQASIDSSSGRQCIASASSSITPSRHDLCDQTLRGYAPSRCLR
jgi:hypothetical protein